MPAMPCPRSAIVREAEPGCFHVFSRCVRRAFLCGDGADHRRAWVREHIAAAAGAFAVDVLAYAVMANHLHLVVRTDPDRVLGWSDRAVAERWAAAHPRLDPDSGAPVPWSAAEVISLAKDAGRVAVARLRLRSVSWCMKSIKERLARRANREDGCTGAFWEGRFRCVPLLDQAAVLACMAYVDLNPIRAGLAETPEASDFTSVQERFAGARAASVGDDAGGQAVAVPDRAALAIAPAVVGADGIGALHATAAAEDAAIVAEARDGDRGGYPVGRDEAGIATISGCGERRPGTGAT